MEPTEHSQLDSPESIRILLNEYLDFLGVDRGTLHQQGREGMDELIQDDVKALLKDVLSRLMGMEIDTP